MKHSINLRNGFCNDCGIHADVLTTRCPGKKVQPANIKLIRQGKLDFTDKGWVNKALEVKIDNNQPGNIIDFLKEIFPNAIIQEVNYSEPTEYEQSIKDDFDRDSIRILNLINDGISRVGELHKVMNMSMQDTVLLTIALQNGGLISNSDIGFHLTEQGAELLFSDEVRQHPECQPVEEIKLSLKELEMLLFLNRQTKVQVLDLPKSISYTITNLYRLGLVQCIDCQYFAISEEGFNHLKHFDDELNPVVYSDNQPVEALSLSCINTLMHVWATDGDKLDNIAGEAESINELIKLDLVELFGNIVRLTPAGTKHIEKLASVPISK